MDIYTKLGKYLQREIDTYLLPKLQYDRVMRDIKIFRVLDGNEIINDNDFYYYQLEKITGVIKTLVWRVENYYFFDCDDVDIYRPNNDMM
jgi:hypothetical protein